MIRRIIIFTTLIFLTVSTGYALDPVTHEALNETIATGRSEDFSLDDYLKNQLGFTNGITEVVYYKKIWQWIQLGGLYEDKPNLSIPYRRSFNHYHDPLSDKGYAGIWNSLAVWSQLPKEEQSPDGHYSWHDAREYFYQALTNQFQNGRNSYYAKTFRALGQLMHLVQDASVPSHTRDDGHILYNYEKWVVKYPEVLKSTPITFDKSILNSGLNYPSYGPISNIFDTNQYTLSNSDPEVTWFTDKIGLAEYTNANFFSNETIFSDSYPHPAKENTTAQLVEQVAKDGNTDKVWYIQGYTSQRLAAYSYLTKYLVLAPNIVTPVTGWLYNLDDYVYADYASQLIPRTIGYSAGLLEYFFRGQMAGVGKELVKNGAGNITGITMKIKNLTPDESIDSPGKFVVSYQYTIGSGEDEATIYGVSDEVALKEPIASGDTSASEYTFNFDPAIPIVAKDMKFRLVYRGKLGAEDDAVAAASVKIGQYWMEDFTNAPVSEYIYVRYSSRADNYYRNPPTGQWQLYSDDRLWNLDSTGATWHIYKTFSIVEHADGDKTLDIVLETRSNCSAVSSGANHDIPEEDGMLVEGNLYLNIDYRGSRYAHADKYDYAYAYLMMRDPEIENSLYWAYLKLNLDDYWHTDRVDLSAYAGRLITGVKIYLYAYSGCYYNAGIAVSIDSISVGTCSQSTKPNELDTDGDGEADWCDTDDDGDGVPDE